MTTCWKCADSDAAYQAKCTAPACGMRETAEPSASPAELRHDALVVNLMRMVDGIDKHKARECASVVFEMLKATPSAPSTSPLTDEQHRKSDNYLNGYCVGRADLLKQLNTLERCYSKCFDERADLIERLEAIPRSTQNTHNPLTENYIIDIANTCKGGRWSNIEFARAIEAAHGIALPPPAK